jgi:hypothetical protein
LPQAVDKLTPQGRADAAGSFPVRLSSLSSCLGLARALPLAPLRWMGNIKPAVQFSDRGAWFARWN